LVLGGETGGVSCDSVAFDQSRVGHCQFKSARIDNAPGSILIGIIPTLDSAELYVEPGNGEIARAYFSYVGSPQGSVDTLTTATLPPYNTLKFVGTGIVPFVPEFAPGLIELFPTGISHSDSPLPPGLAIHVYPNPSNSGFNLEVFLHDEGDYCLHIFNILGQELLGRCLPGREGSNLLRLARQADWASGVYYLRVSAGGESRVVRALLLK